MTSARPKGQAMSRKQYIITVNEDADPDTVAADLKAQGLEVDNVMKEIRVISASSSGNANSVRSMKGIASVEESGEYQIPDPDSPVQ